MPPPSVTYNKDIGVITIGGKFSLSIASAGKVSDALVDLLDEIDADGQANG
jgi:hypothetical protein